jgi:hypothetical protein
MTDQRDRNPGHRVYYAHKRKHLNVYETDPEKIKEKQRAYYKAWYERTREQRNANKKRLVFEFPPRKTERKKSGPPVKVGQPWRALGVSKTTYYRNRKRKIALSPEAREPRPMQS